jgi:hypothetical protein
MTHQLLKGRNCALFISATVTHGKCELNLLQPPLPPTAPSAFLPVNILHLPSSFLALFPLTSKAYHKKKTSSSPILSFSGECNLGKKKRLEMLKYVIKKSKSMELLLCLLRKQQQAPIHEVTCILPTAPCGAALELHRALMQLYFEK